MIHRRDCGCDSCVAAGKPSGRQPLPEGAIEIAALKVKCARLERIVNTIDDCLLVDWIDPPSRDDGAAIGPREDYRRALYKLKTNAIQEHTYFEYEEKIAKLVAESDAAYAEGYKAGFSDGWRDSIFVRQDTHES